MSSKSLDSALATYELPRRRFNGFRPGGWGDNLIFGYIFRVLVALAAGIVPAVLMMVWGSFNGWVLTKAMIYFFGLLSSIIVFIGEWMRLEVYERHAGARKSQKKGSRDKHLIIKDPIYAPARPLSRAVQRVLDLTIVIPAIFILAPLMIVSAMMVKFDSPGPIIFRQSRIGFRGKQITVYKFRTFSYRKKAGEDSEVVGDMTRSGVVLRRTSIDELPLLFNVISGDLSLVGPRPLEISRVKSDQLIVMNFIKPGITGLMISGQKKYKDAGIMSQLHHLDFRLSAKQYFVILFKSVFFTLRKP